MSTRTACKIDLSRVKRLNMTVARNSAANILRGAAGGVLALVLPPILTRTLDHDRFAAWVLILQFAAYVNFLDFGLQTALGRFVARAIEEGDPDGRNRIVSTALGLLTAAAALAWLTVLIVVLFLPHILHPPGPALLAEMRRSILVLAAFYAVGLPLSAFTGTLVGMQRSEFTAIAIGGSKILGGVTLVLLLRESHSLVLMAIALGVWQVAGGIAQYFIARSLLDRLVVSLRLFSREVARELVRYCSYMSVWMLSGFLISGLDLIFVTHYQFSATGYYAIASNLLNFIATLNGAIFSALIPATAVLHSRGEFRELGRVVVRSTRIGIYILLLAGLPFLVAGRPLLRLWIGAQYAENTLPLLYVLLVANIVRLSGNAYAVAMMGTNQHRQNIFGTMAEGIVNVVASILLARSFGAIGVAGGTMIGAAVGLLIHVFYNVRRTREIDMSVAEYGLQGLLSPALLSVPLLLTSLLPLAVARGMLAVPVAVAIGMPLAAISAVLIVRHESWWPPLKRLLRRPFRRPPLTRESSK
jgi:O-antigen/teichoic acid export membrane protein